MKAVINALTVSLMLLSSLAVSQKEGNLDFEFGRTTSERSKVKKDHDSEM